MAAIPGFCMQGRMYKDMAARGLEIKAEYCSNITRLLSRSIASMLN
jgi:hypothetical protein